MFTSSFFNRQFGNDLTYYEEKDHTAASADPGVVRTPDAGHAEKTLLHRPPTPNSVRRLNRLRLPLFPPAAISEADTIQPFPPLRSATGSQATTHLATTWLAVVRWGHRALGRARLATIRESRKKMEDYFLQWLPSHLLALEDYQRLIRLLKDFRYLMEKTHRRHAGAICCRTSEVCRHG